MLDDLKKELRKKADPERARVLQGFFKTNKGGYAEGDVFLGITVPEQRKSARKYSALAMKDIKELLKSRVHELRLVALIILCGRYKESGEKEKERIFRFYLKNTKCVNNWDLVDLSAPKIVGDFLMHRDKKVLYTLAASKDLWERRIAIIATLAFIREGRYKVTLGISRKLLKDKHDLIHKAVGWMLRETGKRDVNVLEEFLKKHYNKLPRTTLRYAIERFGEAKRKRYLKGAFAQKA